MKKKSTECSFLVVDPLHSAVKEGSIPRVLPWYLYQYSVFVFIELVRWGKCVFVGPLVDRVWTRRRRSWKRKGNPVAPSPQPADPKISCLSKNVFLSAAVMYFLLRNYFFKFKWWREWRKSSFITYMHLCKPQQNTFF